MKGFKIRLYQIVIAIDQLANTLVWGWADETFSARCWRKRENSFWGVARRVVDLIFFWDKNHCREAFNNEMDGIHKPGAYRRGM